MNGKLRTDMNLSPKALSLKVAGPGRRVPLKPRGSRPLSTLLGGWSSDHWMVGSCFLFSTEASSA